MVDPLEPYLYTATPTLTLKEGDCNPATTGDGDFDINVVNVHAIPGGDRQETPWWRRMLIPLFGEPQRRTA